MKQYTTNNGNRANRLVGRLAAEKKKTVIAFCLISVMVFMWARVLGKKTPQSAGAAGLTRETMQGQSNSELKISFVELPKVQGRNDVLTRDVFSADGWQEFAKSGVGHSNGIKEVNVFSKGVSEEVIRRVAEKLKLEAIGLSENPEVFINDKLLTIGGTLLIKEGVETYECEVVEIEQETVLIRCGEAEIKLKLMQVNEVVD
ncbi:MAG: hypothetical protein ACYTE5_05415 [Planctomycetota bacterium]|jgi:hypothetical protein